MKPYPQTTNWIIVFQCLVHRVGKPGQELKAAPLEAGTEAEAMEVCSYQPASHGFLSLPSYSTQNTVVPTVSWALSQENVPQACSQVSLVGTFSQPRLLFSQRALACIIEIKPNSKSPSRGFSACISSSRSNRWRHRRFQNWRIGK